MKKKTNELAVFKMSLDCGRMGSLEGVFVASKEHVEYLTTHKVGVYFGEVLGKHSEIYGAIDAKEITMITDKQEVIDVITKYDLANGYNPFEYTLSVDGMSDEEMETYQDMGVAEYIEEKLKA